MHYCEERFLDVARRFGVLGLPARHVPLEDALKAHASQARACCACTIYCFAFAVQGRANLCSALCSATFAGACMQGTCECMHLLQYLINVCGSGCRDDIPSNVCLL